MNIYSDTNFLVAYYLNGFDATQRLASAVSRMMTERLPITWLHERELYNAFLLRAYQCAQGQSPTPRVTSQQALVLQGIFEDDLDSMAFLKRQVVPTDEWQETFEQLAARHTATRGFRTYDLLHVSAAIVLRSDAFWSYDQKASELAKLEGLSILT